MKLYPIKFTPILKDKIWGGNKLETLFGKNRGTLPNIGESWEISGYNSDISVVKNGFLEGNTLEEVAEIYMSDLLGDKVYESYGQNFPLLFKLIDANQDLSIQVHPNDDIAMERHQSFGKTEMWYILNAEPGACLTIGFTKDCDSKTYVETLEVGKIETILQKVPVTAGDAIFIPAGMVHAIGKGIVLAEIQQTSDITYRIYDYDRLDANGNKRSLHTAEALDVINFEANKNPKIAYKALLNSAVNLAHCPYFTTNILYFNQTIGRDYAPLDSFVVYMCIQGEVLLEADGEQTIIGKGETVLIPACLNDIMLTPKEGKKAKLLEIYID